MSQEIAERNETAVEFIPQDQFNIAPLATMPLPESYDDALALFESVTEISDASEDLADEWPEIDKDRLVNVPFLIVAFTISSAEDSEYGSQYVVVRGITATNQRFRFTDGSTGVFRQLVRLWKTRSENPATAPFANVALKCPNGLTRSEYNKIVDGKNTRAVTHYIAS